MGRIAVFGLGNVLLHDDAFGPQAVRELKARWDIPWAVFVDDLGTPGLELSTHLAGYDTVILADAVAADRPPGTILRLDREEILRYPGGVRLGPHDPSLAEVLLTMDLVDDGPSEVVLVGAVPESTQPGIGLCTAVRSAATIAAGMIADEIERRGHAVSRRRHPVLSPAWWESSVGEPAWVTAFD